MRTTHEKGALPARSRAYSFGRATLVWAAGLAFALPGGLAAVERQLVAEAGESRTVFVGEVVSLDASASRGASSYHWDFGDERSWDGPRAEPVAEVVYDAPGRHLAVLTAYGEGGTWETDFLELLVIHEPVHRSNHGSSIQWLEGLEQVAVVSPDSNELTLVGSDGEGAYEVVRRLPTCENPRTVTAWHEWLAVACQLSDTIDFLRPDGRGARLSLELPYGSHPFAVVGTDEALFVTLQGPGALARIELDADAEPRMVAIHDAVPDARALAELPDGRLAVTRWRSPDEQGEIAVVDPETGARQIWTLRLDPRSAANEILIEEKRIGGLPTYLNQIIVSPDASYLAVPSLQANIVDGRYRTGTPLTHETTLRSTVSFIDLETGEEMFDRRWQFERRGLASSAVFNATGDYLLVANRGSRTVDRVDLLEDVKVGRIHEVGFAPEGLALSADGRHLFVDSYLSREVAVYDITGNAIGLPEIVRLPSVGFEPLSATLLRGKQLFNDSLDERLTLDHYLACAHCHMDDMGDNRIWDFTALGEGLRNTITLIGRGGLDDGPLHWSANFDEVQDFEQAIRDVFGGTGLMEDGDFFDGCRDDPMGDLKTGVSEDLDALAAFVTSLRTHQRSPFRRADGSLTEAAERGRAIFESVETGCATCHSGERLTDSGLEDDGEPRLHIVGTMSAGTGHRSREVLQGIDTPTLHGLWNTPPYLHNGTAPTIEAVLTTHNPGDRHGVTSHLDERQLEELAEYLLSLDGRRD
ncbi:MAG: PKD domain-containing protein [Acidobacteriota bacterium]